ncbi:hypothetical protein BZA77DRAFT_333734 [Pyronema omphalodes]|nr:hypothetical protein BZA77DRAFT_333734 [Pyronema omphalodes]
MDDGSPAPSSRRITSSRDRAKIRYIPPDLDVDALIAETSNFQPVPRLDATQYTTAESMKELEAIIKRNVIEDGTPLVITNWHKRSDWPWLVFSTQWLQENHGKDHVSVRDLTEETDIRMSLGHYLRNLPTLESKFTAQDYKSSQQRLYAKDIDCPPLWRDKLREILPRSTFYLCEYDLMASLPKDARAENMMCYFGHEGTYTPAHKDMCASLGQNIMVCATGRVDEEPGSSIWFMTKSSDRHTISEYWLSRMGHDIEVEKHFASIEDLQDAPFPVYIHEQNVGDYILVPPLAPHQVWNRGQATLKAAWNRITVETLELALSEALPKMRLVCRDESYRCRAIVYDTLKQYYNVLRGASATTLDSSKIRSDFVRLFKLFDRIMLDECFNSNESIPEVERIENEYNVTCSFCRGNIWNRFLSCKSCTVYYEDGEEDCYDVCMDCYARGRSCACISKLSWVEQFSWKVLNNNHEYFRRMAIGIQGGSAEKDLLPLARGFEQLGRKSLASVCQEQLKIRPWQDVTRAPKDTYKKNGPKKRITDEAQPNCHVCKIRHESWKCAECSTCGQSYCYGNLWRAFDLDPFDDILSKGKWECPKCLKICSCGNCRKKGQTVPYRPKGTVLGFSTKHVADPRSTDSLVDFARGNLGWIKQTDAPIGQKRKRNSIDDTYSHQIDPALFSGAPCRRQVPTSGLRAQGGCKF